MKTVVEMDYSYLVEMEVPQLPVNNILVVLNQLNKDIEVYYELLMDAEKNNDLATAQKIEVELAEMKEMAAYIEQPELHRHLRLVSNNAWREFHEQR